MKITNPQAPPRQQQQGSAKSARPSDQANGDGVQGAEGSTELQGRDFAGLLDEAARPTRQVHRDEKGEAENRGADDAQRAQAGRPADKRRAARREGEESANESHPAEGLHSPFEVRAAGPRGEVTNARAILHIADLEKLVSAVRTQVLPGGRSGVTLVLHRSVLDGLRVKLSADAAGRINAEFIASTDKVRAQVEARTAELSELLRSRGIALAGLRTSVGTGAGHDASGGRGEQRPPKVAALTGEGDSPSGPSAVESAAGGDDVDDGSTYRA